MKKALLIVGPVAVAATIGAIACRRAGGCNCPPGQCTCGTQGRGKKSREGPDIRARLEKKMARMPEASPRRMMFDNIATIREQTTRILELLEPNGGRSSAHDEAPTEPAA